jgi:hypothetical protein
VEIADLKFLCAGLTAGLRAAPDPKSLCVPIRGQRFWVDRSTAKAARDRSKSFFEANPHWQVPPRWRIQFATIRNGTRFL